MDYAFITDDEKLAQLKNALSNIEMQHYLTSLDAETADNEEVRSQFRRGLANMETKIEVMRRDYNAIIAQIPAPKPVDDGPLIIDGVDVRKLLEAHDNGEWVRADTVSPTTGADNNK